MIIVGRGMIAKSMDKIADKHCDVTVYAAGVSKSSCFEQSEYDRDWFLLSGVLKECIDNNHKLVYFSSGGAIYGDCECIRSENSALFPISLYGRHKLLCESLIINSGVRYLIIRLPNVVGSTSNDTQLVPFLLKQLYSGRVNIFREAERDLIDIDDVVSILDQLLEKAPDKSLVFNIASGYSIPVIDIFLEMQKILGISATVCMMNGGTKQKFDISKLGNLISISRLFSDSYFKNVLKKYTEF